MSYADLTGDRWTYEQFADALRPVGLRQLLQFVSRILTTLHAERLPTEELQRELVQALLSDDLRHALDSMPNGRNRIVFFPQQLLLLAKLAIVTCVSLDETLTDRDLRTLATQLALVATDVLEDLLAATNTESLETSVIAQLVRNHHHNRTEQPRYLISRTSIMFRRLPLLPELADDHNFTDLPACFRHATGAELDDYLAFGWTLYAHLLITSPRIVSRSDGPSTIDGINPSVFFSLTTIDRTLASTLLNLLTTDIDCLKVSCQPLTLPDSPNRMAYGFLPFMSKPLCRLTEDYILPINLRYIADSISEGPFWIISDALPNPQRERFRRFFGKIVETYACAILARLTAHDARVSPVYRERVYRVGRDEKKPSDAVLLYPRTAVFVEVVSTRLRFEGTILSQDDSSFDIDLDQIVFANARQLTGRIRDFRSGFYDFDGVGTSSIERIVPVIVTFQALPHLGLIADRIQHHLAAEGLLSQPDVAPLQIVDLEELEILETIVPKQAQLWEILDARSREQVLREAPLKNLIVRNFVEEDNTFLGEEYRAIAAHARILMAGRG